MNIISKDTGVRMDYDSLPESVMPEGVYRDAVRTAAIEQSRLDILRKDRDAQDSLKAELKAKGVTGKSLSDAVLKELGIDVDGYEKALGLFASGFDEEHVADAIGVSKDSAVKLRDRFFDPVFKVWYKAWNTPEKKEEVKTTGGPSKVHEKLLDYVFKPDRQRVRVTVEFKSKFSSVGEMEGDDKDPEFTWKEYRAEIKERSGKHFLHYTFVQDLDPKTGKLVGTPQEKLVADDAVIEPSHVLMKAIRENMKKYVLPEDGSARGVTPMHHTFSVHYVNTYHGDREVDWQDFHSVEDFVMKHHGIFPKDEQHQKWEDDKRRHEERKVLGPYQIESELTALITQYERDIKKETDPAAKETMKKEIKKLRDMIKDKADLDQKALDDLIRQEMMLRHPTHVPMTHEVTTEKPKEAGMLVYSLANLPPPGGGGTKDFVNIAKKYGGRNLDRWFDPGQMVQLAEIVNREIDRQRVLHIKDPDIVSRLDGDKDRFQKLLPEFIHDMRVRVDILKKKYPLDYESLAKNRDVTWIDDAGKITKLLEDVKGKFTSAPATAVVLPAPKSKGAQELVSLFYSYGLTHNPNPKFWLEPGDFSVLAKSLNAAVAAKLEKELKADKPKSMSKEDWDKSIKDIKLSYEKDLQTAEKLFPEFLTDLKERRDEFAKNNPLDYKALSAKKNTHWVDNDSAVKDVLKAVAVQLREPLKPAEKKQPGMKIIEIGKFEALGGFLREQLKGFLTLGSRFKRLSVNTVSSDETLSGYKGDLDKLRERYDANVATLNKGKDTLTNEEKDALSEARTNLGKAMDEARTVIESKETIPAIKGARVLLSYMRYFSSLYSIFTSMLWYKNKYSSEDWEKLVDAAGAAGDVPADAPEGDKKKDTLTREEAQALALQLQGEIYDETHYMAGLRLKPKEAIKESLTDLRTMLNKFLEVAEQTRMTKTKTAADPSYEEAFKKYVIPEDLLHRGQKAIDSLKRHSNPKVQALAPIAEKEFKAITESLVKVYREGFTDEEIKALAKKKGVSPQKAAVHLRKHQDALTSAAMFGFSEAWEKMIELKGVKKKEDKTPLGNLHPSEYDRMGQFVEDHLPELFKLAPPQEDPKEPSPGIPTPKKIREDIERMWSLEREPTPEEMAQLWKVEADEMGFGGGGGGGKSKARAKAVKTPPPSGTWQQIMHNMSTKVKGVMKEDAGAAKSAMERMVIETLMRQVLTVKKELAKIKGDEYIPVDDVVDGLVYLVKQVFNLMINLKVAPSSRQLQLPPAGAPDFTGTPDIAIDSYKEARKFYDTFVGVTEVINEYLDPHKINIPKFQYVHPEKGSRRQEKYFPNGFMETIQFYQLKEHGISRPGPDKYEPAPHVPGGDEELGKKLKEDNKPSFTGRPHEEYGEVRKADELYDYPTQMSTNIASKFIGVELSDDEFNAVMS